MNSKVFAVNIMFEYTVSMLIVWFHFFSSSFAEDVFKQNIGDLMEIGITDNGYKSVWLKCGSDFMVIDLETKDEFLGVIYTRGSFYDKQSPCFYDTGYRRGQRSFQLKVPFNKCKTEQDGDVYSNVLVLQHDKELIMPGDAAFNLECDFNKPRDIMVKADLYNDNLVTSRITPTDPSPKMDNRDKRYTIGSYTNSVIITSEMLKSRKEEL